VDEAVSAFLAINQSLRCSLNVVRTNALAGDLLVLPIQNILDLLKRPLGLRRLFELFSNPERLLIVCLFRRDPAPPAVLITETSGPILRFRRFPNACHGNNNTNNIRARPRFWLSGCQVAPKAFRQQLGETAAISHRTLGDGLASSCLSGCFSKPQAVV
jgi:hypothetical protein